MPVTPTTLRTGLVAGATGLIADVNAAWAAINNMTTDWSTLVTLTAGKIAYSMLPSGSVLAVVKSGASWTNRPTARTDITVMWIGPGTPPAIITSGVAGRYNGDVLVVTDA